MLGYGYLAIKDIGFGVMVLMFNGKGSSCVR